MRVYYTTRSARRKLGKQRKEIIDKAEMITASLLEEYGLDSVTDAYVVAGEDIRLIINGKKRQKGNNRNMNFLVIFDLKNENYAYWVNGFVSV